jgi:threonine aldolase
MLEAIKKASFGDDYYREDEVTNELEKYSAKYFGTEAALFMITGTMANQVALRCHTSPGDEVISDKYNHIVYYCASAAADLGKVSFNNVEAEQGILSVENVEEASSSRHRSPLNVHPRLVWLENTLNHYGGKIYPLEEFRKVAVYAKERGLKVHLDGARLLNACTATGISPVQYVQNVDSTTFSFSKALGAPAGSILLGDKQLVSSARVYQKWYGGGLHQSGLVAAACLYGLQNNVSRIVTDHRNARLLASSALEGLCGKLLKYPVETNIVMFDVSRLSISSDDFIDLAKKQNLLLYKWNDFVVRAVTHKGITENDVIYASQILRDIFLSLI